MSNSGTPTGENGNKTLESKKNNYKELEVNSNVSKESLADKWADFYEQEGYEGELVFECMSFDVPEVAIKDRVGDQNEESITMSDLQNIDAKTVAIVRPEEFQKASSLPSKTEKNAKAYDREREKAKKESEARRKVANEKIEKDKESKEKEER